MWLFFLILVRVEASPIVLGDIEVLKSDRAGIEFIYTPGECKLEPFAYIKNTTPQPEGGKPSVPVRYISIGVPVGASVNVKVVESITSESTEIYIPPAFGFTQNERNETIYSADAYWPPQVVSVEEQSLYRGQEVLKLRINPLRYNPMRNTLLIYKRLRIRVIFHGGSGVPRSDKIFDPVFKSALINYEQARNWRKEKEVRPLLYYPGPWYKIELQEDGIYKVSKEQLKNVGIVNIDPKTIKIYNGGSKMVTDSLDTLKELSIRVLPDTSVLFYGASLNGWNKNGEAFLNPYTNTNVYWLTYGGEPGRRDSISGAIIPNLPTPAYFHDTIHIESDVECPAKSGLAWIWEKLMRDRDATSFKKEYTFDAHGVYESLCEITVTVYGWVSTFSVDDTLSRRIRHNVRLYLNGNLYKDTSWTNRSDEDRYPTKIRMNCDGLHDGTNILALEMYKGDSPRKDVIFFDWFEIAYKKKYQAHNGNLKFKCTEENQKFELGGFDALPVVFETTDPINPKLIYDAIYENGAVKFKGGKSYYYASTNFKTPILKQESPYNLRNHTGAVDFIIITHPEFLDYANTLKSRRKKQGLETEVFSIEDIYNNFSWGLRHSSHAIRNFLSFAYDNWGTSYCLLFGAGTYAYRDDGLIKNRIPPYEEGYKVGEYGYPPAENRCDDHWYANRNIAIGRITATSKEEARDVIVEKIIKYEQNPGVWQNRVLLIADDETPDGCSFVNYAEGLAQQIPEGCDIFKIYLMNYSLMGKEKPTARLDLIRNWSKGPFLTFFGGHGNLYQLCHEVVLYNPRDIDALYNGIKLPISDFWSCGVACFEREYKDGMADYLQKIKGKGSIGTLASTRATSGPGGTAERIIRYSFTEPQRTIGLVVYGINMELPLPGNCNLFADPSTRLPLRTVEVTVDSFSDTLRGGKPLKIWGQAVGANFAHITVMSSEYTYHHTPSGCQYKMRGRMINEQLCEDILFEGTAKVENGKWSHEFFIPVEIDTLLCGEHGKISAFAWSDTVCGNMATEVTVTEGELNPDDTVGPRIELYANGRLLRNGELVPSDFMLTGVLEDESGINTFNKISPLNLALVLQVNSEDFKPLADYFQYDLGSCRRGSFNYPHQLNPLDIEDTLSVQASDNLGNRSVYKVIVKVVSSARLEIKRVINYPNPVRGEHTSFTFFLSKPAMVSVKVYTISGRLIRTLPLQNKSPGVNQIYWDTRDELGNRIGNGIYIYKISATSEGISKEETEEISKLMILR